MTLSTLKVLKAFRVFYLRNSMLAVVAYAYQQHKLTFKNYLIYENQPKVSFWSSNRFDSYF